jgi:PTS system nitrogen regulatory IIA component
MLVTGGMTAALARSVGDYTDPGLICLDLRGEDPVSVIHELGQLLQRAGRIQDPLPFYHAALTREFLSSTATGTGLAFPHARIQGLDRISLAVGRCARPITWGARGGAGVHLVFLLLVPATEGTEYLLLISALARLEREGSLLARLREARSPAEAFSLLKGIPVQTGRFAAP